MCVFMCWCGILARCMQTKLRALRPVQSFFIHISGRWVHRTTTGTHREQKKHQLCAAYTCTTRCFALWTADAIVSFSLSLFPPPSLSFSWLRLLSTVFSARDRALHIYKSRRNTFSRQRQNTMRSIVVVVVVTLQFECYLCMHDGVLVLCPHDTLCLFVWQIRL